MNRKSILIIGNARTGSGTTSGGGIHTKSGLFAPGISGRGDLAPSMCWAGNRGFSTRIWCQTSIGIDNGYCRDKGWGVDPSKEATAPSDGSF